MPLAHARLAAARRADPPSAPARSRRWTAGSWASCAEGVGEVTSSCDPSRRRRRPGTTLRVEILAERRGSELRVDVTAEARQRPRPHLPRRRPGRSTRTFKAPRRGDVDLLGEALETGGKDPLAVETIRKGTPSRRPRPHRLSPHHEADVVPAQVRVLPSTADEVGGPPPRRSYRVLGVGVPGTAASRTGRQPAARRPPPVYRHPRPMPPLREALDWGRAPRLVGRRPVRPDRPPVVQRPPAEQILLDSGGDDSDIGATADVGERGWASTSRRATSTRSRCRSIEPRGGRRCGGGPRRRRSRARARWRRRPAPRSTSSELGVGPDGRVCPCSRAPRSGTPARTSPAGTRADACRAPRGTVTIHPRLLAAAARCLS